MQFQTYGNRLKWFLIVLLYVLEVTYFFLSATSRGEISDHFNCQHAVRNLMEKENLKCCIGWVWSDTSKRP